MPRVLTVVCTKIRFKYRDADEGQQWNVDVYTENGENVFSDVVTAVRPIPKGNLVTYPDGTIQIEFFEPHEAEMNRGILFINE